MKKELWTMVGVVVVGAVFLALATAIPPADDDAVGPRAVPIFLSLLMMGMAAAQALITMATARRGPAEAAGVLQNPAGRRVASLLRSAAIVATGALYIWLMEAVGYTLSTMICLTILLWLFGNRAVLKLSLLSVGGALVYHLVFVTIMGMNDPAGWLIDVSRIL